MRLHLAISSFPIMFVLLEFFIYYIPLLFYMELGGLTGSIRDSAKATVPSVTNQFH